MLTFLFPNINIDTPLLLVIISVICISLGLQLLAAGGQLLLPPVEEALQLCHLVSREGYSDLALWIRAGADINVGDYEGRTPLHVVCG